MNKKALTEADIRTKFITPAIVDAGWDPMKQIREEAYFSDGHIIVGGKLVGATTAGISKINQGHISECSIPLPPLAEQRRIVAKVDQLMVLVDQWETQLAASRATDKNLLEAVVAELTTHGSSRSAKAAEAETDSKTSPLSQAVS